MVAVIKTGASIRRIFHYNEQKVAEGVATCILAANYPKDAECLTQSQRLHRLLHQAALNEHITRNSVHISLNFDPSEQLPRERLQEIAQAYMERIGFGEQPYLVYQHHDAGHPHIHLVSVKVRADGSRIDMHNIGRNQSESARKELELRFGLVQAERSKQRQEPALKAAAARKVQYGRSETRRAIGQVLDTVLPRYRYTSLPELNAVLGLYQVMADRGSENSRVYRHRGLTYRVLDEKGRKVGVPIKASDFHSKPTLYFLEERFAQNESARLPHKARVRNRVELALRRQPGMSLENLQQALEKDGIHLVLRQNAHGQVYGTTYVDHQTSCVFNGSSLGKRYSAKAILTQCGAATTDRQQPRAQHQQRTGQPGQQPAPLLQPGQAHPSPEGPSPHQSSSALAVAGGVLGALLQTEQVHDYVPHQLRKKRRKKKQRRIHDHL
ncbi:MAG: relaxase/mobilization nuclease domain-containing protein [Hymenobacteraceae bacterium]|nr:relaxase/mobilization nuclease domain-containing protein [Hymenobacteraceae bacterium]